VRVVVPRGALDQLDTVRRLVDVLKPAHVTAEVIGFDAEPDSEVGGDPEPGSEISGDSTPASAAAASTAAGIPEGEPVTGDEEGKS
jgi:hypothetical protein